MRNRKTVPADRWSAGTNQNEPIAPQVGADLRLARERLGAAVWSFAERLRIRPEYLEALEDGRVQELPAPGYAIPFLRTYAAALGLDPNELARRFKAEADALLNRRTELVFPAPMPERGVPAGAMIMLGLLLATGVYAGWYRLSGEARAPAQTVEAVPDRLASLVEPPAQNVASSSPAQPDRVAAAFVPGPGSATQVEPIQAEPAAGFSPSSAMAAPVPVPPAESADAAVAGVAVHATADSWIQVRERGGQVVMSRILHPGETWSAPERADLLLTTGNAGGTEILLDGSPMPSLGGLGMVRRDVSLDPASLRSLKSATAAR